MITKRERARIALVAEARYQDEMRQAHEWFEGTGHLASARGVLAKMYVGGHFDPKPRPLLKQLFA